MKLLHLRRKQLKKQNNMEVFAVIGIMFIVLTILAFGGDILRFISSLFRVDD